jgi:uncharacterized C2H2 Zn-finger protein
MEMLKCPACGSMFKMSTDAWRLTPRPIKCPDCDTKNAAGKRIVAKAEKPKAAPKAEKPTEEPKAE